MSKKRLTIANFNVTFGDKELPMLHYFDEIIYPALNGEIVKINKDNDAYFLDDVQLVEVDNEKFVLTGLFIRSTTLEIKSLYEKGAGIKKTNQFIKSAPYSVFVLFLENHRVVLAENQKGSPDIRSFNSTIAYILKIYIQKANKDRKKEERYPYARVDIVNIPSKVGVIEKLKEVEKIEKLILRLYPLNGEVSVGQAYDSFRKQLEMVGSKSGNVNFNSPDKPVKVAQLIADTNGTAEPLLEVKYKGGSYGTLRSDSFSEKIDMETGDDMSEVSSIDDVIDFSRQRKEINNVSDENKIIYLSKIKSLQSKVSRKKR